MEIAPDAHTLDKVFSSTTYYIDFYQRDYKWTAEPVIRLLDDVFYKFNEEYDSNKTLDPSKKVISSKYPWYYLNTYVTNTVDGKVFVVDGQQRLTTLTLFLIKLFHLADEYNSRLGTWIERKIAGQEGFDNKFWMNHEGHEHVLQGLLNRKELEKIDTSSGVTAENLVGNFQDISKRLDKELDQKHKFETFVFYLLHRLVIINLSVEQTDVPMVFEVINDRGVRLKPYEILKGKLLGQIDKVELNEKKYNDLWESQIKQINDYKEDEIDGFFRHYLKGKHANTRKEGQRFVGEYHREMFSNEMNEELNLDHNPTEVKSFLENEFKYYTDLYEKILDSYDEYNEEHPYIYFNRLNNLDGQFMLILSSCKLNDYQEDKKIEKISYEVDRLFSLLQLQNAYDSNSFNDLLFKISEEIRETSVEKLRPIFNKNLISELEDRRNVEVSEAFQYSFFRNTGLNLNKRFKRYFFARIEKFLADNMNLEMKHFIGDLVSKTGAKTGFHIEHILSHNEENLALFDEDEEVFEQERNRLGGILLLKGKDNISSNNEAYKDKLRSYANTLYWNETLRKDSYKSKLDMRELKKRHQLDLEAIEEFGPIKLEQRHHLLYDISNIIWS